MDRDNRIRTCDILLPKQALCQTELYPVTGPQDGHDPEDPSQRNINPRNGWPAPLSQGNYFIGNLGFLPATGFAASSLASHLSITLRFNSASISGLFSMALTRSS